MAPELSIIIPTYLEAENIPLLLEGIRAALVPAGIPYEVLIVDDNSPDNTQAACAEQVTKGHPLRLITRTQARGLSTAAIRGFEEAAGSLIACMDADLSHPPTALLVMIKTLRTTDAQLVIGSRYVEGGSTDAAWGLFRWLNSKVATVLAAPFSAGARDPMAGFFMMARTTYQQKDALNPIGYKILLEIIVKCRLKRVLEVPIHFRDRRFGQSKLNLREQIRYLRHLWRLALYKYLGRGKNAAATQGKAA